MEKIVLLLLERGADVNAHGGQYGRALQTAFAHKREQIARLLIENGADVNIQVGQIDKKRPCYNKAYRIGMAWH
jgi:ankyrin repeat protein